MAKSNKKKREKNLSKRFLGGRITGPSSYYISDLIQENNGFLSFTLNKRTTTLNVKIEYSKRANGDVKITKTKTLYSDITYTFIKTIKSKITTKDMIVMLKIINRRKNYKVGDFIE